MSKDFKCPICKKYFLNMTAVRQHAKKQHNFSFPIVPRCFICGKKTNNTLLCECHRTKKLATSTDYTVLI